MPSLSQPVGVFGGTFNPIHYGHLRIAQELADAARLERLHLIPTGEPPHRDSPSVESRHRLAMARLAAQGNAAFLVDDREVARDGLCYTVDTLTELRAEYGPERPLVLLVGADAFIGFASWRRWRELFELAHVAVAHRPGVLTSAWQDALPPVLLAEFERRLTPDRSAFGEAPAGAIVTLGVTQLDISSTTIRRYVAQRKSPRYLLPDAVVDYIEQHQLYL
ncbi:nicotinate-nucleotide adenylyltransferase [Chitinivorax sp. PXF-14]|uniref:nicotinate-nucleotide adenylyltransferase n=1 Tax=Chitinivorax sp. PXF-14 TaxID=3230488 RepID=UPI003464FF64